MHECLCSCVCMSVCLLCIYICLYVSICMFLCVCGYVCISVYLCVSYVFVCINIFVFMCLCLCACLCLHMSMCASMYVCLSMYLDGPSLPLALWSSSLGHLPPSHHLRFRISRRLFSCSWRIARSNSSRNTEPAGSHRSIHTWVSAHCPSILPRPHEHLALLPPTCPRGGRTMPTDALLFRDGHEDPQYRGDIWL